MPKEKKKKTKKKREDDADDDMPEDIEGAENMPESH